MRKDTHRGGGSEVEQTCHVPGNVRSVSEIKKLKKSKKRY